MALDLSENNILFLLRVAVVAVLINLVLSLSSTMLPLTEINHFHLNIMMN